MQKIDRHVRVINKEEKKSDQVEYERLDII